jgi:hypothetical protein
VWCPPRLEVLEDRITPNTVNWVGGNGDWDTAGNWLDVTTQTNHLPTASDDAVINVPAITVTHSQGNGDSVHSLASQAAISIAAGSLSFAATSTVNAPLSNNGTVQVLGGTLNLAGGLSNFSNTTLTGGTYQVAGTLQFSGANIVTNAATTVLDGPASQIVDQSNNNALANFAANAAAGRFTIQNGRNFASAGDFLNAGSMTVGSGSTFTVNGDHIQTAGSTSLQGGSLTVVSPANPVHPNGYALSYDGVRDFVSVPSSASLNPTSQITVETWIKPSSLASSQISLGGTWDDITGANRTYLFFIGNGKAQFYVSHTGADAPNASSTTTLQVGKWYHLAGTFDGSNINLYVNGVLEGTASSPGAIHTNTHPLYVGKSDGDLGNSADFGGTIDEFRVWNVARAQAQIQANMGTKLAGNEAGLVEYLPFDEGTGATAFDKTANHNDGSLGGGVAANQPLWVSVPGVNIQAGTLSGSGTVNGNVMNAGQVVPGGVGAAGLMTVNGSYTQTAAGALNVELGGTTAGSQFDQLNVSGPAALDGALNVSRINGFSPAAGNSFKVLTFGSRGADFAAKNGLILGGGLLLNPTYNQNDLTLGTGTTSAYYLPPASGLADWWPGDGSAFDIKGGDNGNLLGSTSFTPAEVGQGFTFGSNSDGVTIPDSPNLNVQSTGFTVDFWMKGVHNQPHPLFLAVDKSHGFVDSTG